MADFEPYTCLLIMLFMIKKKLKVDKMPGFQNVRVKIINLNSYDCDNRFVCFGPYDF